MNERYKKDAYPITVLWDKIRHQDLISKCLLLSPPTKNKKILDVGCGEGGIANYIFDAEEIVGIDISEKAISKAKEKFKHRNEVKFIASPIEYFEYTKNYFDIAFCIETIEHCIDPISVLKKIYELLKEGGSLILTSPNRNSLHLIINRKLGHNDFKCSFDHIREFTYDEIVSMITSIGFKFIGSLGSFIMPYWGYLN